MDAFIQTDKRGRATLTGHPEQLFTMRDNSDGSILLSPARVVTEAQHEYDTNPDLRAVLAEAAASGDVIRGPRRARAART